MDSVIQWLAEHGARLNTRNKAGRTPADVAKRDNGIGAPSCARPRWNCSPNSRLSSDRPRHPRLMGPLEVSQVWESALGRHARAMRWECSSCPPARCRRASSSITRPHRHPEAQTLSIPTPATPEESRAARHCPPGLRALSRPDGLGNGRLAAGMAAYGARPSDLTDDVWQHGSSDGEVFTLSRNGLGATFRCRHMGAN